MMAAAVGRDWRINPNVDGLLYMENSPVSAPTTMEGSVTRHAITWTFDQDYPVGQYVNGDYFVVGSPTITAITQPNAATGHDGSTVDPFFENFEPSGNVIGIPFRFNVRGDRHLGFDDRIDYDSGLNFALSLPAAVLNAGESLTSTISRNITIPVNFSNPDARPFFTDASVLTAVSEAPLIGSFRPAWGSTATPSLGQDSNPPLAGGPKVTHVGPILAVSTLPKLTPTSLLDQAMIDSMLSNHERLRFRHVYNGAYENWQMASNNFGGRTGGGAYGGTTNVDMGKLALMLCCDIPDAEKELLAIRVVQIGIDAFYAKKRGNLTGDRAGAIGCATLFPVVMAAHLLGDTGLLPTEANIGYDIRGAFSEMYQYLLNTQALRDATNRAGSQVPGTLDGSPIGEAVWTERGGNLGTPSSTYYPTNNWTYAGLNSAGWRGQTLALKILGLQSSVAYDPWFDGVDNEMNGNWSTWGQGGADHARDSYGSEWLTEMWDQYRSSY